MIFGNWYMMVCPVSPDGAKGQDYNIMQMLYHIALMQYYLKFKFLYKPKVR